MLMRGIIVNDKMQVFILVSLTFNLLDEFEKLFMCMRLVTLTGHATGGDIEGGKKGARPISLALP